jgi:hypothetical protein
MKSKPILLIHNGNTRVKSRVSSMYAMKIGPMMSEFNNNEDRISFLKTNDDVVSDTCVTDNLSTIDILSLKPYCTVIKAFTSRENDLNALDPSWDKNEFSLEYWRYATMFGIWASDEHIWMDEYTHVPPRSKNSTKFVYYTPGRSGTHLLMNIYGEGIKDIHPRDKSFSEYNDLIESEKIYSSIRINLYDFVISRSILLKSGIVVNSTNQTSMPNINPFSIDRSDIEETLETISTFSEKILFLKLFHEKNIVLSFMEHLVKHPLSNRKYLKNIYPDNVIQNKEQIQSLIETEYQPLYNTIIQNLKRNIGITII